MSEQGAISTQIGARAPRAPNRLEYSLVVQTSFLGDVVLTTPLIARLAQRGPVDVVVTPGGAPLLADNPDVRRVIVYDKRGGARGASGFGRIVRELVTARRTASGRSAESAAYLAQGSVRSAALALLAGFGRRIGFSTSAGRRLYTRRILYRDDKHHAERLWLLGSDVESSSPGASGDDTPGAEPTVEELRPRLYPGARERESVDRLLAEGRHGGERLIALAPGSVWATKRWPYYADLAAALSAEGRIAIVGGGEDRELAAAMARAGSGEPIDATGALSLLGSAELLRRCDVLVTNDSAPQHLASAVGTPTVTVFGPTVPEFGFGPLAPRSVTVGVSDLACRPCDRHGPRRCPLVHWRCMQQLPVAVVVDAVRAAMAARAM